MSGFAVCRSFFLSFLHCDRTADPGSRLRFFIPASCGPSFLCPPSSTWPSSGWPSDSPSSLKAFLANGKTVIPGKLSAADAALSGIAGTLHFQNPADLCLGLMTLLHQILCLSG